MSEYIPFLNTDTDVRILNRYYSECETVRLPYEKVDKLINKIPSNVKMWLDPCVDGYHYRITTKWPKEPYEEWTDYYKALWDKLEDLFGKHSNYGILGDPKEWKKNNEMDLEFFIASLLDKCAQYKPHWISVPQLPLVDSKGRNKINKMLSDATGKWKKNARWDGQLVLPVILTNQNQTKTPSVQKEKISTIFDCFELSKAHLLWITDISLGDQQRNTKYLKRYENLIEFHEKIRKRFGAGIRVIAGPYWGINLVLWAKSLCDNLGVSLSGSYTYNISCFVPPSASVSRIVLPPLKRLVTVTANNILEQWLASVLKKLSINDVAYFEFQKILDNLPKLIDRKISVDQVAKFYKSWLSLLESVPKAGRKFALYQDLSSSYVIGSQLPDLPSELVPNASTQIRKAGKVAEQLMLNCL